MYCPECKEEREIEIREENESYPVKNEQTEINAQVTYCKHCGEQIWNVGSGLFYGAILLFIHYFLYR